MAKRIWLLFLAVVVVTALGFLVYHNLDNFRDRLVWSRFRTELTPANVAKIEFGAMQPMRISDADKAEVLSLLRAGTFYRSNRQGFGPTPDAVLMLTFTDGRQVNFGMWSFEVYELSPERGSQFLIKADPLGVWLRNHFQAPAIG